MERVREEFCVLFFEGKNYLWLTTWDYGRKLYNGADLYYYENGEPVEQASVRMVPESCEVNVEECQGEQWRALAEQAAAAGSEYQELARLGKSRKWTGSAERQAAGDDNQMYLCDLNNDGTEEQYQKAVWLSSNIYTEDGLFDIEKRESIKTLILTLWKRDDEPPSRSEEVALSNAVNLYLEHIGRHPEHKPSFNGFYRFVGRDYRRLLRQKNVREKDFDIDNFLTVLEPYYEGGEYDYLLNSDRELDLLHKRFIVFELDNIRDHKILLPIVTIIIMETYIGKMRRLKGVRKVILIEECWKALTSANMSEYIRYLYKTVRKYFGEAVIVTQEVDDIISSPIVKETIINNADCKILLDQRKYINKFDQIQTLLGLTEKEKEQVLSINLSNDPSRHYKEVWIGLGGVQSAVYATEVSDEEYLCYTTEESEKAEVFALAEKLDGDLEAAIRQLARKRRMKSNPL